MSRQPDACPGFTLVEVLVATCVAAVALAGAWPWLWNVEHATEAVQARAQAATGGAYAVRVIADDLAQALVLLPPPAGRSPATALALRHVHPGAAAETVTIVWDASRHVLWRKASGTYLADQVQAFAVRYLTEDGTELAPADVSVAGWTARVARLTVEVQTARGARVVTSVLNTRVGPA